jgi:AraC-like DNA-binding protein
MNVSIPTILFALVIFQLLFLSFYLFTQEKGRRISNILLALFFLSIALNLLDVFLALEGAYASSAWLFGWGSCLPLLFGPLIYFYTLSVLHKDFGITIKMGVHLLPFAILFLATEIYLVTRPQPVQQKLLSDITRHHIPTSISITSTLIFLQFLGYIVASLRLISYYKKMARQHFSSKEQIDVTWLSSTILFFLLIIVFTIVNGLLSQTSLATYFLAVFNAIILAMLVFVVIVLMRALQKPWFFSVLSGDSSVEEAATAVRPPGTSLVENTGSKVSGEKEKIVQEVLQYMQTSKPYLEPQLSLEQLASKLSLKPRLLSQAINDILDQNFYDFINRYRISEASRLLTNPKDEKITILEVLYEVGFNSKSSFNTLFKKYTGLTPTEFRKKQKE